MTIIPLAQISLKNKGNIHGLGGHQGTTLICNGERFRGELLVEVGVVRLQIANMPPGSKAASTAQRGWDTYLVPFTDCYFVKPEPEAPADKTAKK